tara:strand:+ start:6216 stop:6779 length:564 start_codon:yes stop_codon:yes gene_type:complete
MNIFVLHTEPDKAARQMCDKHVPKMIVESAQMMASAVRRYGATDEDMPLTKAGKPYRGGYKNHPCTIWAGDTFGNFAWLTDHAMALCVEYTSRFGKKHACYDAIVTLYGLGMNWIGTGLGHERTPFALAMPDEFRPITTDGEMAYHAEDIDAVQAYRAYYHSKTFAKWEKGRDAPWWWQGVNEICSA